MDPVIVERLIGEAAKVIGNSYAPYSNIHVASAVLGGNGKIYLGVNVENSSYGLTICAERSAISAMITDGERRPVALAIVSDQDEPIPPCGACRQVIAEFNPETWIIMYSLKTRRKIIANLRDLFPNPFTIGDRD